MTVPEKIFCFATAILNIFMWIYVYINLEELPDEIVTHWDVNGNPNDTGSKYTLLLMPSISSGLFVLFNLIALIPHHYNYATLKVTIQNAHQVYPLAKTFIRYLNFTTTLLFTFILVLMIASAKSGQNEFGSLSIILMIIFPLLTTGIGLVIFLAKLTQYAGDS
jgi:Protein of unknown function (DUF1648).